MIYVFDNSPLSALFKNFYPRRFPTLWRNFDAIVADGRLLSTREALREIEDSSIERLRDWCTGDGRTIFTTPTAAEGEFISGIYAVPHFQHNIEQKKILKGGRNADPFVVAKAAVVEGTVVTLEQEKPNAAKIPNICKRFEIRCISLEEFMETEEWEF